MFDREDRTSEARNPAVFWGKSAPTGESHPLSDHCLDVALVLRALLDIEHLARLPAMESLQKDRLAAIAFLHDLGKCNWGFQAKADPRARDTAGHVLEAVTLLLELERTWPRAWRELLIELCDWFGGDGEAAMAMLLASISHHGRPVSLNDYKASGAARSAQRFWRVCGELDPMRGLEELAHAVHRGFPAAFQPGGPRLDATPTLQHRFAGLVMLADWIGSDTQFFPYRACEGEDRRSLAREATTKALRRIGLIPTGSRQSRDFSATFGFPPSPLQAALAEAIPLDDANRLILVESDTGSGKTEAALGWFLRLYAAGALDGLYFALPTRVAARELYERVMKAMEAAFEPADRPGPVLLAVPGYVKADGKPVLPDPVGTLWDDNAGDRRREQVWAADRPKRFLAAPVGVGTVDQALLSVLQVKHSLLRSVCLDRHLLVVDEVHASNTYMREVLRALLEGHLRRGGWAVLLSATLGESAAAPFFQRGVQPLDQALQRPYPAVSTRDGQVAMPSGRAARHVEVTLSPSLTDDTALVPELTRALEAGARVLVVCNTVARAAGLMRQAEAHLAATRPALLSALFSLDGIRCPHHGRFAREDRERLDARVTAALGKGSSVAPLLLVGTQTLEQSLDIDADWLVTDLAPMDVLLQRIGRLHRHRRSSRPGAFATPRACVRIPPLPLASYLHRDGRLRGPAGLGTVYDDGRVLQRTLDELGARSRLVLPADNRALVELTTHPEAWAQLPPEWTAHGAWLEGARLAELRSAVAAVLKEEPFGELHYNDKSERVLTRLGHPAFDLPLAVPCRSPFGIPVERIQIPAHWLPEGLLPDAVSAEPTPDGFRFALADRAFRYTRFGLEKDDA